MQQKRHKLTKRLAALLLALMMGAGSAGEALTAFAAELELAESAVVEDVDFAEDETTESAEAAEQVEQVQTGTITGFGELAEGGELQASAEDRPTEAQLTAMMADSIPVYLDGSEYTVDIPVTWYCVGGEYDAGTQYYYQFSPKWNTKNYSLADGLDVEFDAPDYGVFFHEGTGITTTSVTRSSNETKTYRFLVEKMGLKCAAALGIMANIQAESGFNPNAVNKGSPSFHGICQWGLGGATGNRWSKLKSWCKKHGVSSSSLNGQLRYMKYELESVKSYHYSTLKKVSNNASGASSAAKTFAKYFEGCSSKYFGTRQNLAKTKYWKEYSPLAKSKIEVVDEDEIMYTGEKQEPELKLTRGDKTLKEGKDYKVSFSDNVEGGEAKIVITGIGGYCGTLLGSFTIHTEAPTLLSATATAAGVKVKWEEVAGAVKYRLYRKNGSGWKKVKDTASLSCTDTTAVSGEVNTYTVRCISAEGEAISSYDTEGISIDYLAAPTLKVAGQTGGVKVSWSEVAGAASYRIFRKDEDDQWQEVKNTTSTSWKDKDAEVGNTYTYRAISLSEDEEKESYNSTAVSVKYLPAPVLKTAAGVNKGIKVSWKKVAGAEKYRVYRKNGSKWSKVTDTTSTSWKDKDVKKNKQYTYTVCCITKDGKTIQSGYDTTGVSAKRKK